MDTSGAPIRAEVEAQYIATRAHLASDPEYQRLTTAAEGEALETPSVYFARNRQALYVEAHMPPITRMG